MKVELPWDLQVNYLVAILGLGGPVAVIFFVQRLTMLLILWTRWSALLIRHRALFDGTLLCLLLPQLLFLFEGLLVGHRLLFFLLLVARAGLHGSFRWLPIFGHLSVILPRLARAQRRTELARALLRDLRALFLDFRDRLSIPLALQHRQQFRDLLLVHVLESFVLNQ